MKVLVIGGTGILGNAIVSTLIRAGHAVWTLTDGKGPLPLAPAIQEHFVADRNDPTQLASALSGANPQPWDCIVDVVCYSARQANILWAATHHTCHRYLMVSTTFVYDPQAPFPIGEGSATGSAKRIGGYAANKLAAENEWRNSGSPVTILRFPHLIAPGCYPGAVPLHNRDPFLVTRLLCNEPVWLVEDGTQALQFLAGNDAAVAIAALIGMPECSNQVYNFAYRETTTGRRYVETLASLLNVKPDIRNVPFQVFEDSGWGWELSAISRVVDVTLLSNLIGGAKLPLKESLEQCLPDWLKEVPPLADDPIKGLEQVSEGEFRDKLRFVARSRERVPIDLRMNQPPSPALIGPLS